MTHAILLAFHSLLQIKFQVSFRKRISPSIALMLLGSSSANSSIYRYHQSNYILQRLPLTLISRFTLVSVHLINCLNCGAVSSHSLLT